MDSLWTTQLPLLVDIFACDCHNNGNTTKTNALFYRHSISQTFATKSPTLPTNCTKPSEIDHNVFSCPPTRTKPLDVLVTALVKPWSRQLPTMTWAGLPTMRKWLPSSTRHKSLWYHLAVISNTSPARITKIGPTGSLADHLQVTWSVASTTGPLYSDRPFRTAKAVFQHKWLPKAGCGRYIAKRYNNDRYYFISWIFHI